MTLPLEQFAPAQAPPRDETGERLFWDARKFGQLEAPNAQVRTHEPQLRTHEPQLRTHEPQLRTYEPQLQGFAPAELLLAKVEFTSSGLNPKDSLTSAVDKLNPERRDRIYRRMEEFETRARNEHLTAAQVDATYEQIQRLIQTPSASLTEEQRLNIAEQTISMAADPTSIDQGMHDTCGAAVVEVRTYMRHPEKAIQLVADAALTGEVWTKSGKTLPIDVTPHDTSKLDFPKSGQRSHASELFQVAAINLALNARPGIQEGSLAYRQNDRRPETINFGERVIDYSQHPPTDRKFEGLYVSDVLLMNKLVTGEDEPDLVMWRSSVKRERAFGKPFTTETEMENALFEAKRNGKLPAIMFVYSGSDPLWQDAPNNADGGRGGGHFINVTDILPGRPPKVEIDSTWWRRADHTKNTGKSLNLSDLYMASLEPKDAEATLRQQVANDVSAGKTDTARLVALARQEWVNGKIDTDGLESSLRELLLFADMRWKNERLAGKLDIDEQRRSLSKTMEAVDRLPYANKLRMLETLKNRGVIDDKEYNSAVVATANEMSEHRMMMTFAGELDQQAELGFRRAQDELGQRLNAMTPEARRGVDEQLKRGQNTDNTGFFASRAKERRDRRKL
ncbi:MAG: hypothetical protein C0469_01775 [Cyanobacteria bacterium DS2.3.42]|nr:hypothetical protein [Cyanobacteria bacterium DS2.3.42]